jgi:hypothetical protein
LIPADRSFFADEGRAGLQKELTKAVRKRSFDD